MIYETKRTRWQRIISRLGIASEKLVIEDNETLTRQLEERNEIMEAMFKSIVNDLIKLGYNSSPELGNELKIAWGDWLRRHL